MSGFLLDTNIVSEYTRPLPHSAVVEFLDEQDNLWLSAVVIHELEYGIAIMDEDRRRNRIRIAVSRFLEGYRDRILPVDRRICELAASMRALARQNGRTLDLSDALIAGTAASRSMTLITRNVRDFRGLDIDIVNPWELP